jgi:hypothetical protein
MKIVVGLKKKQLDKAARSGFDPEFEKAFSKLSGVKLVDVFGRGRFATLEAPPEALESLRAKLGDRFTFARKLKAEPF